MKRGKTALFGGINGQSIEQIKLLQIYYLKKVLTRDEPRISSKKAGATYLMIMV